MDESGGDVVAHRDLVVAVVRALAQEATALPVAQHRHDEAHVAPVRVGGERVDRHLRVVVQVALGIVDKMTPEDEANGKDIAGTGTIDVTGQVGPIGGIRQKLAGATRDGATWFLAPAANCDEVVGHVPRGLRVVRISTFDQARRAVEDIAAKKADDLPTCTG